MKMRNIAILSTHKQLNERIEQACSGFADDFHPVFLTTEEDFVEYLNYELPEIDIIHYSTKDYDVEHTFDVIKNDPWLHFGGSIVIYEDENEQELLKRFRGVNIISMIQIKDLEMYLPKVLHVLQSNRGILFQRDIHALLQSNLSGSLKLQNDPFNAATYSNLLANFLYNSNLVNLEQKYNFSTALMELLVNAIEHGNCRIDYNEKKAFLAENRDIMELIRRKNEDPEIAARNVHLSYRITPEKSSFVIRDEGDGFDWRMYRNRPKGQVSTEMLGRGILIAGHYVENMQYNEKGNEVSFDVDHMNQESNVIPRVFTDQEELTFKDADVVFSQGEKSSHLFYIISGRFEIIANGKKISTLTPADIFLGEMSFLLNNKRSATVIARGDCTVIRISKENFINAIRQEPHYGVFLARLLAQRLDQLHETTI